MDKPLKIAFKTLGCRLNQYETDALVSAFRHKGYDVVPFNQPADVYVVNTCTVTNQSDHKSRNMISQAIRRTGNSVVIAAGCMVNHYKKILEQQPGITYAVQNDRKSSITDLVEAHFKGEITSPDLFPEDKFHFPVTDKSFHTRSLIKIQDGCDNYCSYCIIPKVRGRAVSRPVREILENIRRVTNAGFKEVVLTGVNIGRYQYENDNFEDLVEKITGLPGDFRLRISSIEPEGFGEKLFDLFAHPKLTPHLHLCLQSGSDNILKKMHRKYDVKAFMGMMENIRKRYPDFNFTTDIIVGFPGETEEDFLQSAEIARQARFSHIHTFKFSKRDGTLAARMENQVSDVVKTERSRIIREISQENKLKYYRSMLGKQQKVLIEKEGKNFSMGYGQHYLPVRVCRKVSNNSMVKVLLTDIDEGENKPVLVGRIM